MASASHCRAQDQLACIAVTYYAAPCKQVQTPKVTISSQGHAYRTAAWSKKTVVNMPTDKNIEPGSARLSTDD